MYVMSYLVCLKIKVSINFYSTHFTSLLQTKTFIVRAIFYIICHNFITLLTEHSLNKIFVESEYLP